MMSRDDPTDEELGDIPFDTEGIATLKARKRQKRARRFVKGPLHWPWMAAAARCHPRGLEVVLTVKMLSDTSGQHEVELSSMLLKELGIGRETKRRALDALEAAGLVVVDRNRGRLPRVSLKTVISDAGDGKSSTKMWR